MILNPKIDLAKESIYQGTVAKHHKILEWWFLAPLIKKNKSVAWGYELIFLNQILSKISHPKSFLAFRDSPIFTS